MQDLNDLYYFVQVVDHGGFAPAGRALGEPKSKLSRRIGKLEERLGVQLLQRSTRHFSVTEIGQTYYAHCKAMLVEADAAQEAIELTRAEPCGIVRMSCPVALLEARVGTMLAAFMAQHPRVNIHLEATNRRVDLISEGIDLAIRVRPPPFEDSDLVMRILGNRRQSLIASPRLLQQVPTPRLPTDLAHLPSLGLGQPHHEFQWNLLGPNKAQATVKHWPRFITRDMTALRTAAIAGVGIVQLPNMMIRAELAGGELLPLLPDWAPRPETIHAVFVSRRGLLPSVRTLIDFLVAQFKALDED
ncbi:LysR family transcriptional regulator [Nitrosococcus watsonii]|uniref:Transcriptional regulator, LysR family n=1 Tax=Nitrosococcus watsoni (strain C-113) TaxID=105559 RepID=D8K6J8_NITWC|nr:LysR family transcriptional regulator [Nitrosococcus watsonii]ADJ28525.1 transcriptional regulator, LysR family [Nitrosococcus watsonii C-113]